jgi:type IX secretion system PorP/SprF family membrane protein
MVRITLLMAAFFLVSLLSVAQDVHHTQFFNTPTYMNPAMAGTTPQYRLTALYRNQWSGIPNYQQGFLAFDYNIDEFSSGIGFTAQYDRNASSGLTNMNFAGQYAFYFSITPQLNMRMGGQVAYLSRSIDFSKLVFQDQLQNGGVTAEKLPNNTVNVVDVSAGAVLYTEKFWAGTSIHHLNRPSVGFISGEDKLAMKMSAHIGGKIILDGQQEEVYLLPSLQYQIQPPFNQMIVGTNLVVQPLVLGAWYRGTPWASTPNGTMLQDAFAGYAGIKFDNMLIGYSYDLTISPLVGGGGSHELSITYAPRFDRRHKKHTNSIICPISY